MSLDAVVLDLDDTLLDTSAVLLPAADLRAARAMRELGLPLGDDEAAARLRELRRAGLSEAFRALAREHGLPPECAAAGERAFFAYADDVPPLSLDPEVARALDELAALAPLALLTSGDPATQRRKVERLGIGARFAASVYVDHRGPQGKAEALAGLLAHRGWSPARVVVVGDRPDSDVRAGNRNGCLTVLVRRDGAEFSAVAPASPDDVAWRVVSHVADVAPLLRAAE